MSGERGVIGGCSKLPMNGISEGRGVVVASSRELPENDRSGERG